jgi:hypothetical protein
VSDPQGLDNENWNHRVVARNSASLKTAFAIHLTRMATTLLGLRFQSLEEGYLRMRTTGVLSLTPHFSGVLTAKRNSITVSTVSSPPTKLLKRFNSATVHLAPEVPEVGC